MFLLGDGLGVTTEKDWVIVVPFCLPGERVLTRIYRNEHLHSFGDLVSTLSSSFSSQYTRDDSLVRCKYFGSCSGCQYQMLPYAQQLLHKESVVSKAFANFSSLPSTSIPMALPTLPSPNQYHYRTKLTPHFDPGNAKKFSLEERKESLCIGFESKGKKKVMDIEECPISTLTINEEMSVQRAKVKECVCFQSCTCAFLTGSHTEICISINVERLYCSDTVCRPRTKYLINQKKKQTSPSALRCIKTLCENKLPV